MSEVDLDEVTRQLEKTSVGSSGVSFEGKSLKLNTEEDAKEVTDAINNCQNLQYLNLEGNTLGVDAAKAIASALEGHKEFKRALWKDLFTGRMKTEIPKALQFLGSGLVLAGACLSELDLSDNAFGPIGVQGLVALLRSPSCYSLQILKLNNNGLGVTGGKMLSRGLLECYKSSKENGKPLALRVFVAGRNRLENEGAKALAEVFKTVGTLEELSMPQNGIYHVGITALCDALTHNPDLEVLNLNDNTVTAKGAAAMVRALPSLQKLRDINLGDCLLRTKGALLLAEALTEEHEQLEEVCLECNEIGPKGGMAFAKAMRNKQKLKHLILGGNQFGEKGCHELQSELKDSGLLETLSSLSEDEDEDEDEEDEDEEENSEEEDGDSAAEGESEESDEEIVVKETTSETIKINESSEKVVSNGRGISVYDFLQSPTPERFMSLGTERTQMILHEVKSQPEDLFLEMCMPTLMKVSSLCGSGVDHIQQAAKKVSVALYQELFRWAEEKDQMSIVNNALLVHLGLIKSEDKHSKISWNLEGCMLALENAIHQDIFPKGTQETLHVFLGRQVIDVESDEINSLKSNVVISCSE